MATIFNRSQYKTTEVFFSDIDKNMTKTHSSDMSLIINNADVSQSLTSLVLTQTGSVPFRPEYGTDVHDILFENMSLIQADRLRSRIESSINTYEPRVNLQTVDVKSDHDTNTYNVYIHYSIIYDNVESYTLYIPITTN